MTLQFVSCHWNQTCRKWSKYILARVKRTKKFVVQAVAVSVTMILIHAITTTSDTRRTRWDTPCPVEWCFPSDIVDGALFRPNNSRRSLLVVTILFHMMIPRPQNHPPIRWITTTPATKRIPTMVDKETDSTDIDIQRIADHRRHLHRYWCPMNHSKSTFGKSTPVNMIPTIRMINRIHGTIKELCSKGILLLRRSNMWFHHHPYWVNQQQLLPVVQWHYRYPQQQR